MIVATRQRIEQSSVSYVLGIVSGIEIETDEVSRRLWLLNWTRPSSVVIKYSAAARRRPPSEHVESSNDASERKSLQAEKNTLCS
jgi:hypothetical protein